MHDLRSKLVRLGRPLGDHPLAWVLSGLAVVVGCCVACLAASNPDGLLLINLGSEYHIELRGTEISLHWFRGPNVRPSQGQAIGYQTESESRFAVLSYSRKLCYLGWELPDGCWYPLHQIAGRELDELTVHLVPVCVALFGIAIAVAFFILRRREIHSQTATSG